MGRTTQTYISTSLSVESHHSDDDWLLWIPLGAFGIEGVENFAIGT